MIGLKSSGTPLYMLSEPRAALNNTPPPPDRKAPTCQEWLRDILTVSQKCPGGNLPGDPSLLKHISAGTGEGTYELRV